MLRIFLCDDAPYFNSILESELSVTNNIKICGRSNKSELIADEIKKKAPDVVIINPLMQDASIREGFLKVHNLISTFDGIKLVVRLPEVNMEAVRLSYDIGVRSLILFNTPINEIAQCIIFAAKDKVYVPDRITHEIIKQQISEKHPNLRHPKLWLDDKEYSYFILIASGYSQFQIAEKKTVHRKTVSQYTSVCKEKLNVKENYQLSMLAKIFDLYECENFEAEVLNNEA